MRHIAESKPSNRQKVWLLTWWDVNPHIATYDADRQVWHPDGYGKSYPVNGSDQHGDRWEPVEEA